MNECFFSCFRLLLPVCNVVKCIISGALARAVAVARSSLVAHAGEDVSMGIWVSSVVHSAMAVDIPCWLPHPRCQDTILIPQLSVAQMRLVWNSTRNLWLFQTPGVEFSLDRISLFQNFPVDGIYMLCIVHVCGKIPTMIILKSSYFSTSVSNFPPDCSEVTPTPLHLYVKFFISLSWILHKLYLRLLLCESLPCLTPM